MLFAAMATTDLNRPLITLAYAQSLDGSIAARPGSPLTLSGPESSKLTHKLRAAHQSILIGIGTVLSDNPQLNVRLAAGENPRPIILDSQLRCPPHARLLDAARRPIVVTTEHAPRKNQRELEAVGATVWRLRATFDARLDLHVLRARLDAEGIKSVMVEGGARVITSFLQARLVDRLVLTITPTLIGGEHAVTELVADPVHLPRLRNASIQQAGEDWILSGEIDWNCA